MDPTAPFSPRTAALVAAAVLGLGALARLARWYAGRQAPAGHALHVGLSWWAGTVAALVSLAAAYYTRPAAVVRCQTAPLGTPTPAAARAARAADSAYLAGLGLERAEIDEAFAGRWHTPHLLARGVGCLKAQPTYAALRGGWRATLRQWRTGRAAGA